MLGWVYWDFQEIIFKLTDCIIPSAGRKDFHNQLSKDKTTLWIDDKRHSTDWRGKYIAWKYKPFSSNINNSLTDYLKCSIDQCESIVCCFPVFSMEKWRTSWKSVRWLFYLVTRVFVIKNNFRFLRTRGWTSTLRRAKWKSPEKN